MDLNKEFNLQTELLPEVASKLEEHFGPKDRFFLLDVSRDPNFDTYSAMTLAIAMEEFEKKNNYRMAFQGIKDKVVYDTLYNSPLDVPEEFEEIAVTIVKNKV